MVPNQWSRAENPVEVTDRVRLRELRLRSKLGNFNLWLGRVRVRGLRARGCRVGYDVRIRFGVRIRIRVRIRIGVRVRPR